MQLCEALGIGRGVTAVIGGGGKTTLIMRLRDELVQRGKVAVCTTTHMWPPQDMPVLIGASVAEVQAGLAANRCVCVGELGPDGKLCGGKVGPSELCELADFVIVEADGSRGKPLKAHAAHEPAYPKPLHALLHVVGADGLGARVCDAAHRPGLYAEGIGVELGHVVTPEDVARQLALLCPPCVSRVVVVNKAEQQPGAVRRLAELLPGRVVLTTLTGAEPAVAGVYINGRQAT